jgi:hypothetical protein
MKKIYNIIDSELILRTNNHKLRQEFGRSAQSSNIAEAAKTHKDTDNFFFVTV